MKSKSTLIILTVIILSMSILTFASSALYRIFCEKTGHGGTPKVSSSRPSHIKDRTFIIRFNADIDPSLPWKFNPAQKEIKVRAGEVALAFYEGKNLSPFPTSGMATYNVTPHKAGIYFNKVDCFCFLEQHLESNQETTFPVQFFIDPEIVSDPSMEDIGTITLSYTFFKLKPTHKEKRKYE